MSVRVVLLLLPPVLLFQGIGTEENELDLDLVICRQAEEEFLRLRKEEAQFGESGVAGRGRSQALTRLSNSSLLYELVTTNIYRAARSQKTKRSLGELSAWVLARLETAPGPSDGAGVCDGDSRYRSHSGRCNNLRSPEEGASNTAQRRILPSLYQAEWSTSMSRIVLRNCFASSLMP